MSWDLENEIDNEVAKLHTAPCYDELVDFACHFVKWQKEKDSLPFDEELDKAALKFLLNYLQNNMYSVDSTGTVLPREMAKFGAEWQKKKDEKFRADNNICCMKFDDIEDARLGAYEDGKSAMKRQMMEEAIPANVYINKYGNKFIQGWSGLNQYDEFDNGDEVKIIIVKE